MAAAGKWKLYEQAKLNLGKAAFDLTTGTFNMALFLSTSNADTLATSAILGDLTNQVANAFGYLTGGLAMAGVTYTNVGGTETFTASPVVWTAAGGSLVARSAVIYKVGTFATLVNPIIATMLMDATPADVTATTGQTLTVTMNASGTFTLSGAASN
jgi:hypothetical protein